MQMGNKRKICTILSHGRGLLVTVIFGEYLGLSFVLITNLHGRYYFADEDLKLKETEQLKQSHTKIWWFTSCSFFLWTKLTRAGSISFVYISHHKTSCHLVALSNNGHWLILQFPWAVCLGEALLVHSG